MNFPIWLAPFSIGLMLKSEHNWSGKIQQVESDVGWNSNLKKWKADQLQFENDTQSINNSTGMFKCLIPMNGEYYRPKEPKSPAQNLIIQRTKSCDTIKSSGTWLVVILIPYLRFGRLWGILRETQISHFVKILQILNGYLNRIAFFHRVSNWRLEKCGFEEIKRANPQARIHPSELWYQTDIARF